MYLKKALSPCFEGSHVKSMKLYGEALGWGYGYFNCNAREHLYKLIKTLEVGNTNLSQDRFFTITRNLRVRQFYYPESIFSTNTVICSRCKQAGHNKKNKSCPNHRDQPQLDNFDESENEDQ